MRATCLAAAIVLSAHGALAQPTVDPFVPILVDDALKGWEVEHKAEATVSVVNGNATVTAAVGMLHTTRSGFGNFTLRFDVRADDGTANAFLVLFGSVLSTEPHRVAGLAIPLLSAKVVLDDDASKLVSLVLDDASAARALKAGTEQWQSYEVTRNETMVTLRINGTIVAQEQVPAPVDGWIGFRATDGGIQLRNVSLMSIPSPATAGTGPEDYRGAIFILNADSRPRLRREVKPAYSAGAMRAKIQGTVMVTGVVGVDGSIGDIRVVRSLDNRYGLDENAIAATRQWRFDPGTKDGVIVPVIITIELTFTLR